MKTQISRDTFDTEQRYSGVYLQQGRMILDADWNELTDIEKRRLTDALKDAISGTNKTGGAIAGGAPRVGGLKVYADPADASGKTILIDPGTLYVDGIPARMANGEAVAANAQPDYPYAAGYTGTNQILYADVWERTVTALHDTAPLSDGGEMRASSLMDAGLHGADTATRTQTMLQVKWCGNGVDPLDKNANPRRGNAQLRLKLRAITSSGDTCDPCASQVEVDERIGNYLFRVEVHDYVGSVLTLKWSRDNGSEACATAALPSGFDKGDWVWEFFDDDTEKLLGNHLTHAKDWLCEYFACNTVNQDNLTWSASPTKVRGVILETCTIPGGNNAPKDYARQWDGYIRIDLADPTNASKLSGRDRGVDLALGTLDSQTQGRVVVQDGVLHINLELMELAISATGATYVPGDYWQAAVREAEQDSGDIVLNQATPTGILHHYLYLAELQADKTLKSENNAFARRMAFPPLTDLTAPDVGYALPACSGNTVRQQLNSILSVFPGTTVADILNTLLCNLTALSLPYNVSCPSDSLVTNVGIVGTDDTVGEVLNKLLCNLDANTLPYAVTCPSDPLVLKVGIGGTDDTIGEVLTKLLCNLDATTLPYAVSCPSDSLVTKVGIVSTDDTVAEVLNKLLCNLDANTLPYAVSCPSGPLVTKVGIVSTDDTVGEVLNKLLCSLTSLTLPHTVTCPSGALATKLGVISSDDTVGEVLEKLLCNLTSLTLPHTVTCPSGALATKLGVISSDDTVGEVLNKLLCSLTSLTLPHTVACPTGALVTRLGITSADDTVGEVLDKLLCNLDAGVLSLDSDGSTLYNATLATGSATTQKALQLLYDRGGGGGCAEVVSSSGDLQTKLLAFANDSAATDLWLCLKPGTYPISSAITITGKHSLRISGESAESVDIQVNAAYLALGANEVILENCGFTYSKGTNRITITADSNSVSGCRFSRTNTALTAYTMITVGGAGSGTCRMDWRNNTLYSQIKTVTGVLDNYAGTGMVSDVNVVNAFQALAQPGVMNNMAAYELALDTAVKAVMEMPLVDRQTWQTNLNARSTTRAAVTSVKRASSATMSEVLVKSSMTYSETALAVEEMLAQVVTYSPDYALRLSNNKVGGIFEGNRVDGWLLLGNGVSGLSSPTSVAAPALSGDIINSGGEDLQIVSNTLTNLKANLPTGTLDSKKAVIAAMDGHARIVFANNTVSGTYFAVTARTLIVQGNTWSAESTLGHALADRAMISGNLVESSGTASIFKITAAASQVGNGGNLLMTVTPLR